MLTPERKAEIVTDLYEMAKEIGLQETCSFVEAGVLEAAFRESRGSVKESGYTLKLIRTTCSMKLQRYGITPKRTLGRVEE